MKLSQVGIGFVMCLNACGWGQAGNVPPSGVGLNQTGQVGQAVLQIGGRFCEYHRDEVESALRRFPAVRTVEFLNNHGTVLVRYRTGEVPPVQLATAVEQALASGIGCKAWVDRGSMLQAKS